MLYDVYDYVKHVNCVNDERRSKAYIKVNVNDMMFICKVCSHVHTHTHLNECVKLSCVKKGVLG